MIPFEIRTEHLRPLQIIHFALAAGVVMFLMVVLSLPGAPQDTGEPGGEVLSMLSLVHALVFFAALAAGRFLYDSQLRREKLEEETRGVQPEEAAARVLGTLRRATILRLSLLEVPTFLGLVIILIAKTSGAIEASPVYWLNALSAVFFIGFILFTFPTREKIADLLR